MSSESYAVESEDRLVSRTRVAIVHGSSLDPRLSNSKLHESISSLFSPLGARVFSTDELTGSGISDLLSSPAYDIIGLIGKSSEFNFPRRRSSLSLRNEMSPDESVVLSFAPKTIFNEAKELLRISDALILGDNAANRGLSIYEVMYHFFESLMVPSLMNIDVADIKRIAKGIGLSFNLADDDPDKIINKLPKECLVARSAILHFSCRDDVRLSEVNLVSNAIALKKGLPNPETALDSQDAKKLIRNVNVKIGVRVRSQNTGETNVSASDILIEGSKRISMTAVLFGI